MRCWRKCSGWVYWSDKTTDLPHPTRLPSISLVNGKLYVGGMVLCVEHVVAPKFILQFGVLSSPADQPAASD
jgi:hypothetical protein